VSAGLATHGLSKRFGALTVTDAVSLTLRAGECHALIGGLIDPDDGRIAFLGQDITKASPAERARAGLGRTFQITSIIASMTLFENVALAAQAQCGSSYRFWARAANDRQVNEIAGSALERIGLTGRNDVLAGSLSHGEKRALEPMAGIGNDESAQLTEALLMLKREYPLLLIEHDMDAVFRVADRVSVLVYGRIIASGTPAEIRANPEARAAYLGEEA